MRVWSLPLSRLTARGTALRALDRLSGAAFGIYLVHPIIQEVLHGGMLGVSLSGWSSDPAVAVPLTVLVVFGMSLGLVLLIAKLPAGRFVAP